MDPRKDRTPTPGTNDEPRDPARRRTMMAGLGAPIALSALAATATAQDGDASAGILDGQVAMVTGAARGIGRAIAVAYARAGADIVALDIADADAYRDVLGYRLGSEAELDETAALIEAEGGQVLAIKADVSDAGAMRSAASDTLDRFGRLDIVIANAGVGGGGPIHGVTDAHWKTVLDINLTGAANTMKATLPPMIERQSGRFIAITSVAGRMGAGGQADYGASKWGLVGLVKSAAIDAGPHGITVNAIAPTGVRTGIFGQLMDDTAWMAGFETFLNQMHTLPVGMLEPEDMTGAALFLASPAGQYISGAVIDMAAGMNARYTA